MPRAEALLAQAAQVSGDDGENLLELHWATGLYLRFVGEREGAVISLERALQLARRQQNRWAQFECLMTLTRMDLEEARPDDALARCAELSEVAAKMAEGSELAVAAALQGLARTVRGEASAEAHLAEALSELRRIDAKGALSCVLSLWARVDLDAGRFDRARAHAAEAVSAADALNRSNDAAVARALLGLIVLATGDRAEARRQLDAASDAPTPRSVSAYAGACTRALAEALGTPLSTVATTEPPTRKRKS